MGFRRYNFVVVGLIFLLVALSMATAWALLAGRVHLAIIFLILVLLQVFLLYNLLTRSHREILFFFKALQNDDTSIRYSSNRTSRFMEELNQHLNGLNTNFQEMKMEHELREQYFMRILENLSSGLLVIAKTGHINHINKEALRLFNVPNLSHLKSLSERDPSLYRALEGLQANSRIEYTLQDKEISMKKVLGLQCIQINLKGEDVRIVTIQDLSLEMERKEIDDWIRLIRVMSHEIMNSLAPITSISTTLKEEWSDQGHQEQAHPDPRVSRTLKGLDAIAEQSEGLTTFFESYRVLSRIPDPQMREFPLCTMLEKLETLVVHNPENEGIHMNFHCVDPALTLLADEQMITQVMLNLIKNASQALEGMKHPILSVEAEQANAGQCMIRVRDNGPGIAPDFADEIFLPFFTTRKKGTGVGLSYSRHVMNMHGGSIEFDTRPGKTEFRLLFHSMA
jgi:nitrogen fixation/metabolism regulation signal transduction histidine kinase